jgi:hypothetical protein
MYGVTIGSDGYGYFSSVFRGVFLNNQIGRFSLGTPIGTGSVLISWNISSSALETLKIGVIGHGLAIVPDVFLVSNGFKESSGALYNPASYPLRVGGGVFFIGLDANLYIYAYVLNSDSTFKLLASIPVSTLFADIEFDLASGYIWTTALTRPSSMLIFTITDGVFTGKINLRPPKSIADTARYITIEPESRCLSNRKNMYWGEPRGTLYRYQIPCGSEGKLLVSPVPTVKPTMFPSSPTVTPTTLPTMPTARPTILPSVPTVSPSMGPSGPTQIPSVVPSSPSMSPTSANVQFPNTSSVVLLNPWFTDRFASGIKSGGLSGLKYVAGASLADDRIWVANDRIWVVNDKTSSVRSDIWKLRYSGGAWTVDSGK